MLNKLARVIIAAGTAATAATPAAALGPLKFDLSTVVRYDTNQRRTTGDSSGVGGKRDDVRYSPAASVSYSRAIGRQSLSLGATYGRDYFQNNKNLTRERIAANGGLGFKVTPRCNGNASVSYSRRQNGIGNSVGDLAPLDPAPLDPTVDDVGRLTNNLQDTLGYGVNANCGTGAGASLGGSYSHSELNNQNSARRLFDSQRDSYSLFLGAGFPRPGQLQLVGSYATIAYPNRGTVAGTPLVDNSVKTYRIGLNYSRPIGSRLDGSIGAAYLTARPSLGAPYTAPAYNVALSYRPGVRLTLNLSGARDVVSSRTAAALFRVIDSIHLGVDYKLSRSISTNFNVGVVRNDFRQTFVFLGEVPRSKETSTTVGAGVSYAPRPLYDISFNVHRTSRTSNPSLYSYNSTKALVSLGVHF